MEIVAMLLLLALGRAAAQVPTAPLPLGKLVDVGGYRVHLYCAGEGSPTVMIVGAGFSFDWGLVQPEIAKFTRVCAYDVSGTAWSDAGPDLTCPARVNEIQKLLMTARIEGPYVLVGLSIGAVVARLYASHYPNEVAGMVIVDHAFLPASSPDLPPPAAGLDSPPVLLFKTPIVATVEDDPAFSKLPERIQALHRWAVSLQPAHPTPEMARKCISEADRESLSDIPLVVVSTANDSPGYSQLQARLLALSPNSQQMIAEKSFHSVEISEPDIVISAIREVVRSAQNHSKLKN